MHPRRRPLLALLLALLALLAISPPAAADGDTTLPPGVGNPPKVDFSSLPASASVRKQGADGKPHQVLARLIADRDAIVPGGHLRLGVHLTQDEGWHTYWKSPGEVGKPTVIDWEGPEGVTFSDFEFPAPTRMEQSGIVSYGYDDQVLLFADVQLPDDLPLGDATFGATADARWLVCKTQCIPGDAELTLTLPVVEADPGPNAFAPLFDHYAKSHPVDPAGVTAFAVQGATDVLAVPADSEFKAAVLFTPTGSEPVSVDVSHGGYPLFSPIVTSGWMLMGPPEVTQLDGGAVRIVLSGYALEADPLPTDERFGGLFQVKVGDEWVRTELTFPLPLAAAGTTAQPNPSPLFDHDALAAAAGGGAEATTADAVGSTPETPPAPAERGLPAMLGLAFVGGVLLNIMPCVLPVLTLKLYSLVEQADISAGDRRIAGVAYTGGILASFLALALVVVLLQQSFDLSVGWGFQFQYPGYVIALGTIVFVFALNLFGVFEIPVFGATQMSEASDKEGVLGYFLTGAFATLLATPCSAPFLGTGMGFAFTLPAWGIVLFFLIAGLGLAFPFLIIAFVPALFRLMPRPGAWMDTAKQFLGFTLIATTIWLADVVSSQTGREGGTGFLIFLVAVALGAWIFGRFGGITATGRRQALTLGIAVVIAAFTGRKVLKTTLAVPEDCDTPVVAAADLAADGALDFSEEIPWRPFSEAQVDALRGTAMFIDFTADWCLTCKVNEKNVLNTDKVRAAMSEYGIVPLKADWTTRDETITTWLQRYGKAGVPFYLVIPADPDQPPIPLPEVITPDTVIDALRRASS